MTAMTLTPTQRRVLVDLSEGDWINLVADGGHSVAAVSTANMRGLIRCDFEVAYPARRWTITPDGIAALEASA
jgi:hypothetical protein